MHMKPLSLLLAFATTFGGAGIVPAQAPSPAAQIEEMKKIAFLQGEWSGTGWIMLGPNRKETFKQREMVQSRLGGLLMVIEGLGKSTDGSERVIHNAFAVVSFEPQKKGYRFSAYQANGQAIDVEATVAKESLVWGFKDQRGTTRFTITLSEKGEWFEIGEVNPDGKIWYKFFEMTLQKSR